MLVGTQTAVRTLSSERIDLDEGLERFGFTSFRPGQREAIDTLMSHGELLLVAPTGGGKSLTYQLPASLLPGTTLVVSPLVALMDEVEALNAEALRAPTPQPQEEDA